MPHTQIPQYVNPFDLTTVLTFTQELAVPNPIEYEKGAWSGANSYGPIQAPDDAHGTSVVSKVGGVQLGVAKESSMSVIMNTNGGVIQQNKNGHDAVPERYLESLLRAADDITGNELIYGEVVINLSFSIGGSKHPDALYMRMCEQLPLILTSSFLGLTVPHSGHFTGAGWSSDSNGCLYGKQLPGGKWLPCRICQPYE